MELTMILDVTMLEKVAGYCVYRSEEIEGDRPIADGLYIQRQVLGTPPPDRMKLTLVSE